MRSEGHHTWPKNLGGDPKQRLLGAWFGVHRYVLQSGLVHRLRQIYPEYNLVMNQENTRFMNDLRKDPGFAERVERDIFGFYEDVNAESDPPMPGNAYSDGISDTTKYLESLRKG